MGIPRHVHANARALTLLAVGGLLATVTGCGLAHSSAPCGRDRNGMPTCPVTVKFIESQPEAHLLYPGSTPIGGPSGSGQTSDLFTGTTGAVIGLTAVTTAPMATVYAWYRTWMAAHGWHSAETYVLGPIGLDNEGYAKGTRESFIVEQDSLTRAKIEGFPWAVKETGKTIYDITFGIEPYQK